MILQASTPQNGLKHSNRFLSVFDNFVGFSLKGLKLNQTSLTKYFCKNSFRTFIFSGLLKSSHSEKKIPLNRLFKVSNEQSYQNILLMFFRGLYSNLNIKNLRKRAFIKSVRRIFILGENAQNQIMRIWWISNTYGWLPINF